MEFTKEQLIEHLHSRIEHRKGLIASIHIDRGYRDYLKLELRSSEIALASLEADGTLANEGTITATQFKPVADLYGLTSPTGGETSFTFDAVEARDFIDGGWSCQEYVELERFQEAVSGNSPVIPDGWVACSERMPDDDDFVYIWPRPDFGVELHVGQYCECHPKGDGWYAQVYEQNYGIEWCPITVTHWMPLPAAPQQEVTQALAKGMERYGDAMQKLADSGD
ncbi:DUF551 domain-containing protein [Enterobacter roggenkampii]|uniref:DUF551 domain-containing protein n=1 Tax=Enterobacter roggenkampii TaxID=1812935 RepID=UPI002447AE74|nr:DUF551 domain-containing protein [Enterobacter roggenkampii]MDG9955382.1 DUF551 domain-containing protein [Enterobacter roggenkampii]